MNLGAKTLTTEGDIVLRVVAERNCERIMVSMPVPPIPAIEDDDLLQAVSALTQAALVMRALFLHVAQGESAVELLKKHDDVATLAERVIDGWRDHLGIQFDNTSISSID